MDVAERAGPLVVAVVEPFEVPAVVVFESVVVAAEGCEVVSCRGSVVGPCGAVVEVAVDRRHAASGEDTGEVGGGDLTLLACGGSAAGDAGGDRMSAVGVGDGPSPGRALLPLADLSGEVGDDRSVAGEVTGLICETGEGGEVDGEMHRPVWSRGGLLVGGVLAGEEVEGDVGAELVDAAGFVGVAE